VDETRTELDGALARTLSRKRRTATLSWGDPKQPQRCTLEGRLVIGSAAGAGVVLDDKRVSRLHAELDLDDTGVWLRDLSSSNGTWLGSTRIERVCLTEDAALRVGGTRLLLRFEEPRAVPL
jgi:pSer/pThr/pTyr-binding forkhead associated (FHA) protein